MSTKAYTTVGKRRKSKNLRQGQKAKGQVKNSDGAYVYKVDKRTCLDRFLILGSEGGSYYASEQKLTKDNAKRIMKLIDKDGLYVVNRVVEVSESRSAPKNDPALFVLAMASALGDDETRSAAFDALPKVARIGTHLFNFAEFRENFAGWGRGLRKAVGNWYNSKDLNSIAFQIGKYQSRNGWSHRDILRLAHVNPNHGSDSEKRSIIYKWASGNEVSQEELRNASDILAAYEEIKKTDNQKEIVSLVKEHNLPMEFVPTNKRSKEIYELMLDNFGITALIRNLGVLTNHGILDSKNFDNVNKVVEKITNKEILKKGGVHPLNVLMAMYVYKTGHGMRGSLSWDPVGKIVDALDESFYLSFGSVESTGKRIMIALDVSASMTWSNIAGTMIRPREASAAMSMVTARSEKNYLVTAFSGGNFESAIEEINITPRQRLDTVINKIERLSARSTDCSLPMTWAIKNKAKFDTFIVYTDNETNHWGSLQPATALKKYRDVMGIPEAQLIVVGMVANNFSIADKEDDNMLDVVGFDSSAPNIMSKFIKREI